MAYDKELEPVSRDLLIKELTALKYSIEGIDVENTSPLDVAHTLYNLANDAQVILNRLSGRAGPP